jgi:predicted amidohydrolase YtcJ
MIILYNAMIHTVYPNVPTARALAIGGDRILALGAGEEIRREFAGGSWPGEKIVWQDLGGKTVIPGLTDAHIHLAHYALGLQKVDCETPTREECLRRVAGRARRTPAGEWVLGHGWNQNNWPEGFGSAADLDRVAPDHPVYLTAKSLHAGWVNTAAMRRAGMHAGTPDPEGGRLLRREDGTPSGILLESAMQLVEGSLPEPTVEGIAQAIREALPSLWSMGLTGAHDFDGSDCFAALQVLRARGELKMRIVKSIPLQKLPHAVEVGLRTGFGDDLLRVGSVKAFMDGALGPQTAAMLQPYEGQPGDSSPGEDGERGMLLMDAEELYEHGRLAVQNGLSLAVHAIGDRANHEVLDAFEHLREYERELSGGKAGGGTFRHRIEHVQLIHPGDAHRLGQLGVVASMQPIHATSDMWMADRYWGERAALSYALRTQLDRGATLVFGSDAPVESPNPFWGLHAAVTRRRQDGSPGPEGWYPAQKLSLLEALQGFTSGPASAAGVESRLGRLAPGYLADLVVLDQDPFESDPNELWKIKPSATMVGGEWVFQREI